ncbi:Acetylesterase [Zalerion maritima]|uniref:Acetylesterase n=1 Tax=Zalerion maritima TaxID=339359 RepID=A0AAD5RRK6_9PEZI|nr:Acetylesterase [Zalerion maritima]
MLLTSLLSLVAVVAAKRNGKPRGHHSEFENLVTFGDSYTDENRLGYFINNNGDAPPAGTLLPESSSAASGGYAWGRIIAQNTGAKYYDYAVSGATCSNEIIERYFSSIDAPFPDVMGYEIPAFKADLQWVNETTGTNTLYTDRTAKNTVYALWIGTNDLGNDAFMTDSQTPETTIADFVDCVWEVFDSIYETGGRRFVVLNEAPLEVSPLYAAPSNGGVEESKFWPTKDTYNVTECEQKMLEYTTMVNVALEYGVPFNTMIKKRWPGATFSIFNVHDLMLDIYHNPDGYLESPANVTGYYYICDGEDFSNCDESENSLASFMWYDELHPSQRTDEIIAEEFIKVIDGDSYYGTTCR